MEWEETKERKETKMVFNFFLAYFVWMNEQCRKKNGFNDDTD